MYFLECVNGFYNASCTGICGQCISAQLCDKVNGYCPNGCTSNFQAPLCQGKFQTYRDAKALLELQNFRSVRTKNQDIILKSLLIFFIEVI